MSHDALATRRADLLLPASVDAGVAVTVLSAPPGFGKTTVVAAWARRRVRAPSPEAVAWLNIDDADNDAAVLTSGVLAAVRRAIPEADGVRPPRRPPGQGDLVVALAEVLEDRPAPVWLVLDDVGRLRSTQSLRTLERLLRWLPAKLRLVLCANREQPLGLHRLRVTGVLREVHADALALTAQETRRLVAGYGVRLDDERTRELMSLTEGWPAAVRLMAMAMSESAKLGGPLERLPGTDRGIADYLTGEVLSTLTGAQRHLLRCTSVPDRFDAGLAETLADAPDAAQTLAELARTEFFVVRECELHYRQHPFVRAFLLADLARRGPATLSRLHRLSARWFIGGDDVVTAAGHAYHSRDAALAARLISAHGPELLLRGEVALVLGLGATIPRAVTRVDVRLLLVLAELFTGDLAAAELRLAGLADALAANTSARVRELEVVVRTHRARLIGRVVPEMDELAARLGALPGRAFPVLSLLNRGIVAFWRGEVDASRHDLEQALAIATAQGYEVAVLSCLSYLAGIAASQGEFVEAREHARRAIEFAEQGGPRRRTDRAYAYAVAAWDAYQSCEHDRATEFAARAVEWLPHCVDRAAGLCVLAVREMVEFEVGEDPSAALVRLRDVWARMGRLEGIAPTMTGYEELVEHRLALRVGRMDWRLEVELRAASRFGETGEAYLMQARTRLYRGHVTAARMLLERIVSGAVPSFAFVTPIEAHLLLATLAERAGETEQAAASVRTALELAEPKNVVRTFYDVGQDVRKLLVEWSGRLGRLDSFVAVVLDALPSNGHDTTELTPREVRLLRELPSLATVEEIAATLFVSVNTVKTHLRHIYRKLGVRSRRDAVAVARRRGLL